MVPVAYLHECFDADADAGTLTWKARPLSHFTNIRAARAYRRNIGRLAGRINARGYVIVTLRVDGLYRKFSAHRILWAMDHGAWPEQEIDHINRDRADNRLFNLRDVSRAINQGNKAMRPTSPATGVRAHPSGNFSAYIGGSGKQRHLGTFPTVELAVAARVQMLVKRDEWQALSPAAQQALVEMAGKVRDSMDARADAQREAIERVRNAALTETQRSSNATRSDEKTDV